MHQQELPISDLRDQDPEFGALLQRVRDGSAAAFEELATRVQARVRRWAARLTRDSDDAEDVAQLVLLRLHLRVREFEGRSRFTTWLYRMTRNVALNRRRSEARRARLLREAIDPQAPPVTQGVDREDQTARIAYLVHFYFQELRGRQRQIFELSDLQGKPATEIAERLGVKPVTVRVSLLRARRTIRLRILEEHPELLEGYDP